MEVDTNVKFKIVSARPKKTHRDVGCEYHYDTWEVVSKLSSTKAVSP